MNVMQNSNQTVNKSNHKKRNVIIATSIVVLLLVGVVLGLYFMIYSTQARTSALNNKMEDINKQMAAIPNLDTKENINKFNMLVEEFQATRKQQEKLIRSQLDRLK